MLGAFIREHFCRTAFRMETLQQYEVASDGTDFARYLAGEPGPTPERKEPWLNRLRSERERGLQRSRVRLVTHPVSDYTRFECEWGYVPNTDAGEAVAILDVADLTIGEETIRRWQEHGDFWLIDGEHVVEMQYDPHGQFIGAVLADDATPYRQIAGHAQSVAEPFAAWWSRHLEYHRDPQAA